MVQLASLLSSLMIMHLIADSHAYVITYSSFSSVQLDIYTAHSSMAKCTTAQLNLARQPDGTAMFSVCGGVVLVTW